MHACTSTNQVTHCWEYSSFGLEVTLAWVCKANSPLSPSASFARAGAGAPTGHKQNWGAQLSPASCRGCVCLQQTEAAGRLAGVSGNEHTSTNSAMKVIY